MTQSLLALGILFALMVSASAEYFSVSLDTNSSSWNIVRQSGNISFSIFSLVDGNVSATKYHNRVLSAYQSNYADIVENDISLKERTSSLEGRYKCEENINLRSRIDSPHEVTLAKPAGTDVYTLSVFEMWPALLTVNKSLQYLGRRISDWDFQANNRDFVSSNMLYNQKLTKEWRSMMVLDSMNATVQATDAAIVRGELMATRYLGYLIRFNSTGIADLRYNLAGPSYDSRRSSYPTLNKGEDRYYGSYSIERLIEMRSLFDRFDDACDLDNSLLPSCNATWNACNKEIK